MDPPRVFYPWKATGPHHHNPDHSMHAMMRLWAKRGYVGMINCSGPYLWWGNVGDVLLYNWPTLEQFLTGTKYRLGLFANADLPINRAKNIRWVFWPRYPELTDFWCKPRPLRFDERKYGAVFVGAYENATQRGARDLNYWRSAMDLVLYGKHQAQLKPAEYLRVLRQSRYGLCLRGYGDKCQREIECLAMGCVPIVTPGVSLDYYEPLEVGRHCLLARSAEEAQDLIRGTSSNEWQEISRQGMEWYWRNCSPIGSFETTQKIVEAYIK